MNAQVRNVLISAGMVLGGVLVGTGIAGLLFILGVTLVSTISHSIINPTEWTPVIPLIGLIATYLTAGGSVGIIRSRHPFSPPAVGMIIAAIVFLLVIVGYYFSYAH